MKTRDEDGRIRWMIRKAPRYGREEATNIPDTTTYPVVLGMGNDKNEAFHKHAAFQLLLDCDAGTVTATLEGTLNTAEDPDDVPAGEWEDITNEVVGVASLVSAAAPATDLWLDDVGALGGLCWVRIKIVAATGATTGDYVINHKRWS